MVLLVSSRGDDRPAAPAGRGYGVETILRATPNREGLTADQVGARLADALRGRARAGQYAVTVEDLGAGRVRVFVPGIGDTAWLRKTMTAGLDVAVYDSGTSVAALGDDLAGLVDDVEVPVRAPHAARGVFYRVAPGATATTSLIAGPFGSAREAVPSTSRTGRVVRLPVGAALVLANDPIGAPAGHLSFAVLRDPIVSPGQIVAARADGSRLVLTVDRSARVTVAARIDAQPGAATSLLAMGGPGFLPQILDARFSSYDAATGEMTFGTRRAKAATEFAGSLAGGGVDAAISVEASRRVGTAPPPVGERPAEIPEEIADLAGGDFTNDQWRPRLDTVRKVIEGDLGGQRWRVWSYTSANGRQMVSVAGGSGACAPAPRIIVECMASGGGSAPSILLGRVSSDVTRLEARYADGVSLPAIVQNGFFLVVGAGAEHGGLRDLIARDGSGEVLAELPSTLASALTPPEDRTATGP
ncbi:MAG: hypothetical protein AB7V42_02795 [Thermoleophilia bacterium]